MVSPERTAFTMPRDIMYDLMRFRQLLTKLAQPGERKKEKERGKLRSCATGSRVGSGVWRLGETCARTRCSLSFFGEIHPRKVGKHTRSNYRLYTSDLLPRNCLPRGRLHLSHISSRRFQISEVQRTRAMVSWSEEKGIVVGK